MNTKINIKDLLAGKGAPLLMGILNVTTDSFYDGGRYTTEGALLKRAEQIITEGGDIIDIGAVSTRPGADIGDAQTEREKICFAVKAIRARFADAVISIDTFRAEVARAAVECGADIINDVSGGTFDLNMIPTVGELQVPYVLMHTPATPDVMQQCTQYDDFLNDICAYFDRQLALAKQYNLHDIILDPGFGFGKTVEQNYELMDNLSIFKKYQLPILVGISRKSMICKRYNTTPENALEGTLEVTKIAIQNGADILRVHDVAATRKLKTEN